MNKTKFFKPYVAPNVCALKETGPGVYIIKNLENKIVYIGFSATDVKKTMYRHFQKWNDPTQRRTVYSNLTGIKCRVVFTTAKKAPILEEALILKYKPRDNAQKLEMYTSAQYKNIEAEYWEAPDVPF